VLVTPYGDLAGFADEALERLGRGRRVVLGLPDFGLLGRVLRGTDLLCTVSDALVDMLLDAFAEGGLAADPLPFPSARESMVHMAWRAAPDHDPAAIHRVDCADPSSALVAAPGAVQIRRRRQGRSAAAVDTKVMVRKSSSAETVVDAAEIAGAAAHLAVEAGPDLNSRVPARPVTSRAVGSCTGTPTMPSDDATQFVRVITQISRPSNVFPMLSTWAMEGCCVTQVRSISVRCSYR